MRLILDRALFTAESKEEALALVDLFSTVARDAHSLHSLLTDPPYELGGENGPIDDWLNRRDPLEASAFRERLTSSLIIHTGRPLKGGSSDKMNPRRWHLDGWLTIRVKRLLASDWEKRTLTIADAADLLREPVHLVMENSRTELAFVSLLAGPTDGKTLRALLNQPGKIEVHGGGGGEAKKWIEALAEDPPTPNTWRKLLRAWVLFDKDAGDTDASHLSRHASDFIEVCEKVMSARGGGLSWVCLLRRELESYVPDSGLSAEALRDQQDFVRHVISWREAPHRASWAWVLDLKKGLRGDLRPDVSEAVRKLLKDPKNKIPLEGHMLKAPFSGLSSPEELSILKYGLGERLGEALRAATHPAWASDLPTEYDRGPDDQAPRLALVQSLLDRM